MKKSAMLIPLLLFSLLTHQAQGMGLIRKEVNSMWKSTYISGRARKLLITSPIPTAATNNAKNEKKVKNKGKSDRKEENRLSLNSSSTVEKRPAAADETYPSILDLAGMDYSQARRKPPIHN